MKWLPLRCFLWIFVRGASDCGFQLRIKKTVLTGTNTCVIFWGLVSNPKDPYLPNSCRIRNPCFHALFMFNFLKAFATSAGMLSLSNQKSVYKIRVSFGQHFLSTSWSRYPVTLQLTDFFLCRIRAAFSAGWAGLCDAKNWAEIQQLKGTPASQTGKWLLNTSSAIVITCFCRFISQIESYDVSKTVMITKWAKKLLIFYCVNSGRREM